MAAICPQPASGGANRTAKGSGSSKGNRELNAGNVRAVVVCESYNKQRCIIADAGVNWLGSCYRRGCTDRVAAALRESGCTRTTPPLQAKENSLPRASPPFHTMPHPPWPHPSPFYSPEQGAKAAAAGAGAR